MIYDFYWDFIPPLYSPFSWGISAPLPLNGFVLGPFAPSAIANIKKVKYEMTMFGEYKHRKIQLSLIQNN